jgi:hypothetical protein
VLSEFTSLTCVHREGNVVPHILSKSTMPWCVYPALHTHWFIFVALAPEILFNAHATQAVAVVAAVVIEYVPAAQLVHAALPVAIL